MVVMDKFLRNRYVKAVLSGLKPCIIGIILVTGALMLVKNCGLLLEAKADYLTIVLTCVIALIYFGSRKVLKKGLNPIMLICLSAVVGIVAYSL